MPLSFNTTNTIIVPFLQGYLTSSADHIISILPGPSRLPVDATYFDQELIIAIDGDTSLQRIRYSVLFVNTDNLRNAGYYVQGGPDMFRMDTYSGNTLAFPIEYHKNTSMVFGYNGVNTAQDRDISFGI